MPSCQNVLTCVKNLYFLNSHIKAITKILYGRERKTQSRTEEEKREREVGGREREKEVGEEREREIGEREGEEREEDTFIVMEMPKFSMILDFC